jgi:sporulation protein YlmC with PRC-barrel domain
MRFSEAKNHKVVATGDAATVAKLAGFVVEASSARIVALRLKKTDGDVDLLNWTDVQGFGPDAVTVTSPSVFVKAGEGAKRGDLLGSRVLTERGVELGEVKDVDFDPADGVVRAVLTKSEEVAGSRLLGHGSYALVVREA